MESRSSSRDKQILEKQLADKEKEIEELKARLLELEKRLEYSDLSEGKYGNLAEAALGLNGVFESAQKAAENYLEEIRLRCEETERQCRAREEESRESAIRLLESTQARCSALEEYTESKCRQMTDEAQLQAREYWIRLSEKLDKFYREHEGLKEIVSFSPFADLKKEEEIL